MRLGVFRWSYGSICQDSVCAHLPAANHEGDEGMILDMYILLSFLLFQGVMDSLHISHLGIPHSGGAEPICHGNLSWSSCSYNCLTVYCGREITSLEMG